MLKRLYIAWKFRRLTSHFDREIATARAKHWPVKHLQAAKSDFVHSLLASRSCPSSPSSGDPRGRNQ